MPTKARFTKGQLAALADAVRELLANPPGLEETLLACGSEPPEPDAGWVHLNWLNGRLRERGLCRESAAYHAAREGLDALLAVSAVEVMASVSRHDKPRKYYRWARLKPGADAK